MLFRSEEAERVGRPHMQAPDKKLPEKVIEQPTSKTSIYKQGELIYDGATGLTVGGAASADGSEAPLGQGMNQLLSWGIRNSDPEELKRRAEAGEARTLTPLDKDMLEVLRAADGGADALVPGQAGSGGAAAVGGRGGGAARAGGARVPLRRPRQRQRPRQDQRQIGKAHV